MSLFKSDLQIKRYHQLVNKKYEIGLTHKESAEMAAIGKSMDADCEPFYCGCMVAIKSALSKEPKP